jgi:hypothetical protein
MEIPSRNTIFLQGVFFDKIQTIEDKMISETMERSDDNHSPCYIAQNVIIPSRFRSIKLWKEATKNLQLRCWYCSLSFMGVPCFIPRQIKTGMAGKEFDTYGWFCGFACAYSFLISHAEYRLNKTYFDKIIMLKMLFISFYKKKVQEFYEAPNKYKLITYGGYLDLSDYKNQLKQANQKIVQEAINCYSD